MSDSPDTWSLRLLAVLERGLSPSLLTDPELRRRALLIAGTALLAIAVCALSIPVIAITARGVGVAALLIGDTVTLSLVGLAYLLLRRGRLLAAGHLVAGTILAGTLYAIVLTGSFASPFWIILAAVPVLAAQMIGRAGALLWTGVTLLAVGALFAGARLGTGQPRFYDTDGFAGAAAFFGAMTIVVVYALSHLADRARDDAIARAEQARSQLAHADVEIERARILAHHAVSANSAKSAFMTTMSHELRTPLNAVIGYAEMLVEDAEKQGLRSMRDDLIKIVGASQHLLGLIDDILDLSRVEAEKLDLRRERFAADDIVREVTGALQPLARARGNVLEARLPQAPVLADLDRGRVRQVLINLVGNALKFTARGRVTVHVHGETEGPTHYVVLAVEDTGIGIREADCARIFEPFTQVDSTVRRRYEGTGLGLALCKSLVEMMGGTISVRSVYGEGSTFTVRLPAAATARSAPPVQGVAC